MKCKKKFLLSGLVLSFYFAQCVNYCYALQLKKLGQLEINPEGNNFFPFVTSYEKYDTNIYRTSKAVTPSWINRAGVGCHVMRKGGQRIDLNAAYLFEAITFSKDPHRNNALHHSAELSLESHLPLEGRLGFTETYLETTDQENLELAPLVPRVQNTLALKFAFPLKGNFGLALDPQFAYHNYLPSQYSYLDRNEFSVGGSLAYQLQPKTALFSSYHFGGVMYKDYNPNTNTRANDAQYHSLEFGIMGRLTPRLIGRVGGGVQFRNYQESLFQAANNATTGSYSADLSWKPTFDSEIKLSGARGNMESVYLNSRFYTLTATSLSLSKQLRRCKLILGLASETSSYPEETMLTGRKRRDNNVGGRFTIDYRIQRWLKAGFVVAMHRRYSNESQFRYQYNVTGLGLIAIF